MGDLSQASPDTQISIQEGALKSETNLVHLIHTEKKIVDHTLNYLIKPSIIDASLNAQTQWLNSTLTKSSKVDAINKVANNHSKSVLSPNSLFGTCLT